MADISHDPHLAFVSGPQLVPLLLRVVGVIVLWPVVYSYLEEGAGGRDGGNRTVRRRFARPPDRRQSARSTAPSAPSRESSAPGWSDGWPSTWTSVTGVRCPRPRRRYLQEFGRRTWNEQDALGSIPGAVAGPGN
jgi:hypothetical protein